jgi:hypothetical protein
VLAEEQAPALVCVDVKGWIHPVVAKRLAAQLKTWDSLTEEGQLEAIGEDDCFTLMAGLSIMSVA